MFGFYTEYGKKIKYIYLLNHTQSAPQPAAAGRFPASLFLLLFILSFENL